MPADPLCPVFGACGGCAHQDISHEEELALKEDNLKRLFGEKLGIGPERFQPIVASPHPYHYRSRVDVALLRTQDGRVFMGFAPGERPREEGSVVTAHHPSFVRRLKVVPVDSCAIAMPAISKILPELKARAEALLPRGYRTANLVVKTGDDGRVAWGGIGRRSLEQKEADYFWTEVEGKRIFYSLGTFFQSNLSILGLLARKIINLTEPDAGTVFGDLYSGVGLFGICMADRVKSVLMIEDAPESVKLARYNAAYHKLRNVEILEGRVEDKLPSITGEARVVLLVDPPRKGLSAAALAAIASSPAESILYLSCNAESLARDLVLFRKAGWEADRIVPFDLFPKTRHLETLVRLRRG